MWRSVLSFGLLPLALGCSNAGHGDVPGAGEGGDAPGVSTTVDLGTPGGDDGLGFVPMADGEELRVQTFGQGGTHVLIGVRASGFGTRAFVSAELENLESGTVVEEPAPARPQLFYCDDSGFCDLVPYLVHTSGLTKTDAEKDGLRVRLTVNVQSQSGASNHASRDATLSTADL